MQEVTNIDPLDPGGNFGLETAHWCAVLGPLLLHFLELLQTLTLEEGQQVNTGLDLRMLCHLI